MASRGRPKKNVSKKDADIVSQAISKPSGYAYVKLGMDLHPKQKQSLDTLFSGNKKKLIFRCCNAAGKTSYVMVAAVLYSLDILNAQVVSTSATYRQITTQLMPAIRRYSHLFPDWEFLENAIVIKGEKKYIGFSSDQEANWQGYHEFPNIPLVILLDEAAGLPEAVFHAVDRCRPTYYLITGSPLSPEGTFYNLETNPELYKFFDHIQITALECPWIKKEDIDMMLSKWGADHPLVRSSIYAEFSNESLDAIISLSSLNKCITNPPEFFPGGRRVGIDIGAGTAENVISYRCGNMVKLIKCWRNTDTMSATGEIIIELDKLKQSAGLQASEVYLDADGMGLPVGHRLHELGWHINLFHGNSAPFDPAYKNKIAECWLNGAKKIMNCQIIIPNDNDLKAQILARKQKLNSSGKMQLESKEDMASRGVSSPDRADAFFMSLDGGSDGMVTDMKFMGMKGKLGSTEYHYM